MAFSPIPDSAAKGKLLSVALLFHAKGSTTDESAVIIIFGTFQASLDGKPFFRSAKVQGLLIYLALTTQQAHERDVQAAPCSGQTNQKR